MTTCIIDTHGAVAHGLQLSRILSLQSLGVADLNLGGFPRVPLVPVHANGQAARPSFKALTGRKPGHMDRKLLHTLMHTSPGRLQQAGRTIEDSRRKDKVLTLDNASAGSADRVGQAGLSEAGLSEAASSPPGAAQLVPHYLCIACAYLFHS